MTWFLQGKSSDEPPADIGAQPAVVFATAAELDANGPGFALPPSLAPGTTPATTRFESHPGLDYCSVMVPGPHGKAPTQVELYLVHNRLLVVGSADSTRHQLTEQLQNQQEQAPLPGRALVAYFALLLAPEGERLEDIEDEIDTMEDTMVADDTTPPRQNLRLISAMRHRLLGYKRYFEGLLALLEDLSENTNKLLDKQALHSLHIQQNRAGRLLGAVQNLREYVTQVREAYQNQLDISLNETMKLFTVITAVFLPLTLIAGWYGMNLQMPEFALPWAYPAVIVLSLAVAVGCLIFFKRRRWF